jgi:hypothetical protein
MGRKDVNSIDNLVAPNEENRNERKKGFFKGVFSIGADGGDGRGGKGGPPPTPDALGSEAAPGERGGDFFVSDRGDPKRRVSRRIKGEF